MYALKLGRHTFICWYIGNEMNITSILTKSLILLSLTSMLMGCMTFDDKPAKVVVRIKTTNDLNPDNNGRPSPIVVRIYSLKSDATFNNARFFELFENGQDVLGSDLTGQQEIEIFPGETKELNEKTLSIDSRYIGILAAYRDLDSAVWRGIITTPLSKRTYADVTMGRLSITVVEGSKRNGFLKR